MTKVDFKKRGETNSKLRCDGAWNDVTQRVTLFQVLVQVSSRYCVYQQFFFYFFQVDFCQNNCPNTWNLPGPIPGRA